VDSFSSEIAPWFWTFLFAVKKCFIKLLRNCPKVEEKMPVYVRLELNKPVGRHHFFRSGIGTGLGELGFGRIVLGHGTKECLLIYTIVKSS